MTDETYAVNCSMLSSEVIRDRNAEKENDRKRRFNIMFYVALFSRISWMVGAVLGGILGQILPVALFCSIRCNEITLFYMITLLENNYAKKPCVSVLTQQV